MLAARSNVDIVAARIHPFDPCDAFESLSLAPCLLDRGAAICMAQQHIKALYPHRVYLPLDRFAASIAGRRYSATSFAPKLFRTVGGATKSQNAVTSIADSTLSLSPEDSGATPSNWLPALGARPTAALAPMPCLPLLYKFSSVMALLEISHATVYRMVAHGELELIKLNTRASRITSASVTKILGDRCGKD